jgi:serine protease Do
MALGLLLGGLVLAGPLLAAPRWGWFGIRIRDLSELEMEEISGKLGLKEGFGVLVVDVVKGSPAETSSLRAGDLIVAIDERPITDTRSLQRMVGGTPTHRALRVTVLRERARQDLTIRVGEMPGELVAERVAAELGFVVRGTGGEEPAAGAGPDRPAVVGGVAERSPAAQGGLQTGDRVLAVNGAQVASLSAFQAEIQRVTLADPIRLRVERKGEPVDLVLVPPPARVH